MVTGTFAPYLFKGDNIYLWEDLAWIYDAMDLPDKSILCLKEQASLMPSSAEPYLNMDTIYSSRGCISAAISVYLKGLRIDPADEFLSHNISSLLNSEGRKDKALRRINAAIVTNPDRALNHKVKGDIRFDRHEYHLAIASYEWALATADEEWRPLLMGGLGSARACILTTISFI